MPWDLGAGAAVAAGAAYPAPATGGLPAQRPCAPNPTPVASSVSDTREEEYNNGGDGLELTKRRGSDKKYETKGE